MAQLLKRSVVINSFGFLAALLFLLNQTELIQFNLNFKRFNNLNLTTLNEKYKTEKNISEINGTSNFSVNNNLSAKNFTSKSDVKFNFSDIIDKNLVQNETTSNITQLDQCPLVPPNLVGPIKVDSLPDNLKNVEEILSSKILIGGRFKPTTCIARDRVAIIIPFRDRPHHLPILLKNLHPFLMKQQIDYGIFLAEQSQNGSFNRAKLMNIGFVEALKIYDWDCFVFHDVDLLPMDDRNLYNCPKQPRHMSVAIDKFKWKLPYKTIFGGVAAMTKEQFEKVNGFSNSYFGWGAEDDDLSKRIRHAGYKIERYSSQIARYSMLSHKQESKNPKRSKLIQDSGKRFATDGLNSLKYNLLDLQEKPLFTWIYVDVTSELLQAFIP